MSQMGHYVLPFVGNFLGLVVDMLNLTEQQREKNIEQKAAENKEGEEEEDKAGEKEEEEEEKEEEEQTDLGRGEKGDVRSVGLKVLADLINHYSDAFDFLFYKKKLLDVLGKNGAIACFF